MKKRIVLIAAILYMFFPGAATHAFQSGDVIIHGFISQGYLYSDKNNYLADTEDGTFEFNEMGINFSTNVASDLRIGMQLFARDLGETGNDEITVPWAFADYSWREWLGLRVGFMKPDWGFYGEKWDVDPLRTSILLPQAVYDETVRDSESTIKGLGIYGNILLSAAGVLYYQAQYGVFEAGSGIRTFMDNRFRTLGLGSLGPLNITDSFAGKLQWSTPLDGLRAAYSYVRSSMDMTNQDQSLYYDVSLLEFHLLSIEYLVGNFLIGTEFGQLNVEADLIFQNPMIPKMNRDRKTGDMGYINLSYRFTDWLQLGGYYSMYEGDKDYDAPSDPDDDLNTLNDLCLTLRFDINENWIVKVEGHNMDGALDGPVTKGEDETKADDQWNLYAVKVSYNF